MFNGGADSLASLKGVFRGVKRSRRVVTAPIFPNLDKTPAETGFDRECVSSNPLAPGIPVFREFPFLDEKGPPNAGFSYPGNY
jgi:hypothetical protein